MIGKIKQHLSERRVAGDTSITNRDYYRRQIDYLLNRAWIVFFGGALILMIYGEMR